MISSVVLGKALFIGTSVFIVKWVGERLFDPIRNLWDGINFEYKLEKVKKTNYGWNVLVYCTDEGNYEDFLRYKGTIEKIYGVRAYIKDVPFSDNIEMDLVRLDFELEYKKINLSPYELLIGYDSKGEPIICNMKITPHLGVVGISNNGKSKCIELMLNNLDGADIDILNAMDDDYTNVKCNRINGNDDILDYLYYLTHEENKRERPLYVVIDEYNVLSNLDGLDEAIEDLLRQARHRNVFVIVIGQQMDKESCNFKNLFNARLCFKQLSPVQYYSFLGITVDEPHLKQREFYFQHTEFVRGKSFKIIK